VLRSSAIGAPFMIADDVLRYPRAIVRDHGQHGIAWDAVTLHTIAGVYVSPGPHHYRLRGLPFGWSRVVPLAEEATAHQRRVPRPRETPPDRGGVGT